MRSNNRYFALGLLLGFINCDLFMNDEIKDKPLGLFNKVHSVLDASATSISSRNSSFSQNVVSGDIISDLRDDLQKDSKESSKVELSNTISEFGEAKIQKQQDQDIESENSITTKVSKVIVNNLTGEGELLKGTEWKSNNGITLPVVDINFNSHTDGFESTLNSKSFQSNEIRYSNDFNFSDDFASEVRGHTVSSVSLNGDSNNSEYSYSYLQEDEDKYDDNNGYEEEESEDYEKYYADYDKKESEEKYDRYEYGEEYEYNEEEEKFYREYELRLRNTKDSVKEALKLARQIEKDWKTVEFHKIKLSPIYGKRAENSEKLRSKGRLSKFNKNKLTEDLTNLLGVIEKSLNYATRLTTNDRYLIGFKKNDQQAKIKLDKLQIEVTSLIAKVKGSHKEDYQSYLEIGSYNLSPKTKSELEQVLMLLYGITGAR